MPFNKAYSAERGYDLRTPYNIPMGEIRYLRMVPPFSPSTYQKNTMTMKLPSTYSPPPTFPRSVTSSLCSLQATFDKCTQTYTLKPGAGSTTTPAKENIVKLIKKNTWIK